MRSAPFAQRHSATAVSINRRADQKWLWVLSQYGRKLENEISTSLPEQDEDRHGRQGNEGIPERYGAGQGRQEAPAVFTFYRSSGPVA